MKTKLNTKGSMLIWVVMLGAILSSVFIIMALRLKISAEAQRETMEYLNAKAYLESIADDWAKAPVEKTLNTEITGSIGKNVNEIRGFLEEGNILTQTLGQNDIFCWGKNGEQNMLVLDGALLDDETEYSTSCSVDTSYYFSKTGLTGPHTFQTLSPAHYKIKAASTIQDDTAWHISLKQDLSYNKFVTVGRKIPASP